jgi:hypothetical protein
MAYLGNAPARSFISFERQVFTIVNSQTAYTLSHSVNNENDIRLVINNIVQEPGSGKAYTASGTTLTLSAALTNGTDEMYCVFLGRAVATNAPGAGSVNTASIADLNVTTAKLADSSVSLAKLTATGTKDATTFLRGDNTFATVVSGLTMADQWRLTTGSVGAGDLTSNLERNDSTGYGQLGTGMTESSGVFTFPSTGIYLISFSATFYNASGDSRFNRADIKVTTNNSSYTTVARGVTSHNVISSAFTYSGAFTQYQLDVTDTSNVKVMFSREFQESNTYIEGDTASNKTFMTFLKLGDT